MCYKGKCFHCIPVDTGCLVLAILIAVASGVICLGSIIVGSITISNLSGGGAPHSRDVAVQVFAGIGQGLLLMGAVIITTVLAVTSFISFVFSAILCNGISKRRPAKVKAYFIYGVVATVLLAIISIAILAEGDNTGAGLLGLFGCVVHSLFLVLVHHTHAKLVEDLASNDQIHLVESSKQLKC